MPLLRARVRDGTGLATAPPESRGHLDEEPGVAGRQSAGSPPAPGAPAWLVTLTSSAGGPRVSRPTRQPARQTALGCRVPLAEGANPRRPSRRVPTLLDTPPYPGGSAYRGLGARRGGAWTPTLGVGVPEKCERPERSAFGCVGAAGGAGGGLPCRSLPGLATQTQAPQSPFPPPRSARRTHRRLRTHPTGAFGPGKGLGREAVALLCLPPPLVGLPAAGWHSPVSAIERLIIIILKFFSILCFIF